MDSVHRRRLKEANRSRFVLIVWTLLVWGLAALLWGLWAVLGTVQDLVHDRNALITRITGISGLPDTNFPYMLMAPPPPNPPPAPLRPVVESEEADECALPRKPEQCRLEDPERIHIVFVSAMWYREPFTQHETNAMIKSVLAQTRCKLWIHFLVAGSPETEVIPEMMERFGAFLMIPNPPRFMRTGPIPNRYLAYVNTTTPHEAAVLYSLHDIPTEWVEDRAKDIDLFPLTHHAGVPGMCKFFMADILWQVKKAVYLDVDMLLGGDVQDLWDYFGEMRMDKRLMYYMSSDNPEGRGLRGAMRPYCSCQMVLNLQAMRRRNLTGLLLTALAGRPPRSLEEFVDDGDQWLFTWVCKQYKGACRVLPRLWNLSGCSKPQPFLGLTGRGREINGSCWRVVHFNCLGHSPGRGGAYLIPRGWVEAVRWARRLNPQRLKQSRDTRVWKVARPQPTTPPLVPAIGGEVQGNR